MKQVWLIKMCLNKTYNRVGVDKYLSNMFPISYVLKRGDALSPLIFNFALEYAIRRVQVNQDGLKFNGTHQLSVYADVNILSGSVHTVKKNTANLLFGSKEIGLEVNADKTKHKVMFRNQNAGRSQNIKIDNSSIESVEEFKYSGTNLTN